MREIHYLLKRKDGGSDLAVIGKEKSLRHMTYRFLLDSPSSLSSSIVKLRSRREVVDWLHSFLPGSSTPLSPQTSGGSSDGNESDELGHEQMKGYHIQKLGHHSKDFQWVGSPTFCKKRRKHYEAYCRNGIKISVHEFVYILAEEDKRLVAYLEDIYEDAKGNKMVVVRWFHKSDEVGIDLPHNFNDREIFFSLCLQDLSIECIDGSATVLSPEHYSKFLKGVKHTTKLEPLVCHQQYDNDELKPLDITQVKGYWKQEIVRYIISLSSSRVSEKSYLPNDSRKKGDNSDIYGTKQPRKRLRLSRDSKVDIHCANINDTEGDDMYGRKNVAHVDRPKINFRRSGFAQGPAVVVSRKDINTEALPPLCTSVGSEVEILSQDSGMRGCWFRAVVIKKHKNKVKLRYNDIKDAENEANSLEEWVLASRIAVRDEMGVRVCGRTTIRPSLSHEGNVSRVFNIGAIVDVWWHDGWWEGIVIHKESDDKFQVYFPGEKREAFFCGSDLRPSQEWIGNTWKQFDEHPDLAASILSKLGFTKTPIEKEPQASVCDDKQPAHDITKDENRNLDLEQKKGNSSSILDLSKVDSLSQLRWKTFGKRRRIFAPKLQTPRRSRSHDNHRDFMVPRRLKVEKEICKSVKVDRENCKYITESLSLLGSSVVPPPLTSLVMSR